MNSGEGGVPLQLQHFIAAQDAVYPRVVAELAAGAKSSHWMWFIFPQRLELGRSETARRYGLVSVPHARAYAEHAVLGARLRECARALRGWIGRREAAAILGEIDALKLRSSMTLFEQAMPEEPLFAELLQGFYAGVRDPATLALPRQADGGP